jgi:ferredoxin-NADP reductase
MTAPTTLNVRVVRKAVEAEDICSLELAAVDGGPLPAFSAGSHVDVQLPGGLTRQYSLCNDPAETHRYLLGVLKDAASRGGSRAVHEQVQEGSLLQISPPKNHFALAHDAQRHLLLAGGIGVTPILCMAERLARTGAAFEMHYATRSKARTAFAGRIARVVLRRPRALPLRRRRRGAEARHPGAAGHAARRRARLRLRAERLHGRGARRRARRRLARDPAALRVLRCRGGAVGRRRCLRGRAV